MTVQLPSSSGFSLAPSSLGDPAFEPQSIVSDETLKEAFPHLQYYTTTLQSFLDADHDYATMNTESDNRASNIGHSDASPDPSQMSVGDFTPSQLIPSPMDTSHIWSGVKCSRVCESYTHDWDMPGADIPYITDSRAQLASVHNSAQMSPDDYISVTQIQEPSMFATTTQMSPGSKMDNVQRARHAANQRHAKAEKNSEVREDSKQIESPTRSPEIASDESKRIRYREKNRIAAAKTRMKKNGNIQELEVLCREMSAKNKFAKAEMEKLRNELICLRTTALQHASHIPGCNCLALHAYNKRKASELATEWSLPASLSPSCSTDLVVPSATGFNSSTKCPSQASGPATPLARERRSTSAATGCDAQHMPATKGDSAQYDLFDFLLDSAVGLETFPDTPVATSAAAGFVALE